MVRRSSDEPRTITDNVKSANERLEELARAQGKGAAALRAGGHVLEMNAAASIPVITPVGMDSAVAFTADGRVSITSEDGDTLRDFRARVINATGSIGTDGNIVSKNGVLAEGPVSAGGGAVVAGESGINGGPLVVAAKLQAGAGGITSSGIISGYDLAMTHFINDYMGNVRNPQSRRHLKTDIRPLSDLIGSQTATDVVLGLDVQVWKYDPAVVPTMADGTDHVGIMLEDLEAVAPALVCPAEPVHGEDGEVLEATTGDSYSMLTLLSLAVAAIKEQAGENADLRKQVAELADRVDASG